MINFKEQVGNEIEESRMVKNHKIYSLNHLNFKIKVIFYDRNLFS